MGNLVDSVTEIIDEHTININPSVCIDNTKDVNNSKSTLYALILAEGMYYCGVTDNLDRRLLQHKNGEGAEWTKKYHFVDLHYTKPLEHPLDEDNEVKKLMSQYGIDKVRGGSYSNIELTHEQLRTLRRELTHANGECFTCFKIGHYSRDCPEIKEQNSHQTGVSNKINPSISTINTPPSNLETFNQPNVSNKIGASVIYTGPPSNLQTVNHDHISNKIAASIPSVNRPTSNLQTINQAVNHGKKWTNDERSKLRSEVQNKKITNILINEIATSHGRTSGGIRSELIKQGIITQDDRIKLMNDKYI